MTFANAITEDPDEMVLELESAGSDEYDLAVPLTGGGTLRGNLARVSSALAVPRPNSVFPNLEAPSVERSADVVAEQTLHTVEAIIANSGDGNAPGTTARLYLSTDDDFDTADDYYVGDVSVDSLVAGATTTARWTLLSPDIGDEPYEVWEIVVVDVLGQAYEAPLGEDDNIWRVDDPISVEDSRAHGCCVEGQASCTDIIPSECVCAVDEYCCTVEWDLVCVAEITALGCGGCNTVDPCEVLEYYSNGVCDLFCWLPDPDCDGAGQECEPGFVLTRNDVCCPDYAPYYWDDGTCRSVIESEYGGCSIDVPYPWNDGTCRSVVQNGPDGCPADAPFPWNDGSCRTTKEYIPLPDPFIWPDRSDESSGSGSSSFNSYTAPTWANNSSPLDLVWYDTFGFFP